MAKTSSYCSGNAYFKLDHLEKVIYFVTLSNSQRVEAWSSSQASRIFPLLLSSQNLKNSKGLSSN